LKKKTQEEIDTAMAIILLRSVLAIFFSISQILVFKTKKMWAITAFK